MRRIVRSKGCPERVIGRATGKIRKTMRIEGFVASVKAGRNSRLTFLKEVDERLSAFASADQSELNRLRNRGLHANGPWFSRPAFGSTESAPPPKTSLGSSM